MTNDKYMRFALTYLIRDGELKGMRAMLGAVQYRYTYETYAEAQAMKGATERNNSADTLAMFPGLAVTKVECWRMRDGSVGDPKRCFFEAEETCEEIDCTD